MGTGGEFRSAHDESRRVGSASETAGRASSQKAPVEDELPDFSGKLLLAYFDGTGTSIAPVGHFIEAPVLKLQGGRLFLVGRLATNNAKGWHGAHTAIAWDAVVKYVVLDSMLEYDAREMAQNHVAAQQPKKAGWFS